MIVTTQTPELLIARFTRWKGPLLWALATLFALWVGVVIAFDTELSLWVLVLWLGLTVTWFLPLALLRAEKSMLVLNGRTGQAELRHRDIRGLHHHVWPLQEVQSTRITRRAPNGPASADPRRVITLFVKVGMDEGRHKLTHFPVAASDALATSAAVSDWMKAWRKTQDPLLDSHPPEA